MKKQAAQKPLTKSDLVSVLEDYPTRRELKEELLDLREGIIDQVDSKMKKYNDKVLTGLDKISKELQDMREENAAGTLHFERLDEKVEDHEKRINALESPPNP